MGQNEHVKENTFQKSGAPENGDLSMFLSFVRSHAFMKQSSSQAL